MLDHSEPELIDYLRALWRWKWLIVAGPIVTIAATLATYARGPSTYLATQLYDIGAPTDDQTRAIQRILSVSTRRFDAAAAPARIESPTGGVVIVNVTAEAEAAARQRLQEVTAEVDRALSELVAVEQKRLEGMRQRRDALVALATETRDVQRKMQTARNDAMGALLYLQTSQMLIQTEGLIAQLESVLAVSRAPDLMRQVEVRAQGVRPWRMLVVVSAIGGLILFVVIALVIDYVQTADRSRMRRLQST